MRFPFVSAKTKRVLEEQLETAKQKTVAAKEKLKSTQARYEAAKEKLVGQKAFLEEILRQNEQMKAEVEEARRINALHTDPRALLSLRFLRGQGLEIGALHRPTPTAQGTTTRYFDYLSTEENEKRCSEMIELGYSLVKVDYIGNAETLETIADDSLDFIIANHVLEHCQDVIGTLKNFLRKLRKEGALLISLPDKRYTYDFKRPITPFEHLIQDHVQGTAQSLYPHYVEAYQSGAFKGVGMAIFEGRLLSEEELLRDPHVDMHFHVWGQFDMLDLFMRLKREHGFPWEFEGLLRHGGEVVFALRKETVEEWDRGNPATKPSTNEPSLGPP